MLQLKFQFNERTRQRLQLVEHLCSGVYGLSKPDKVVKYEAAQAGASVVHLLYALGIDSNGARFDKGEILPGEQPSMIDKALFEAVRQKLFNHQSYRTLSRQKSEHVLKNLPFDDAGHIMRNARH